MTMSRGQSPGPVQRVGLSATQRPMEEIGRFVSGGRPIELDAGRAKARPGSRRAARGHARAGRRGSIWPSIYPEILRLVQEHRSTIVFVNNRRLAERLALRLTRLERRARRGRCEAHQIARAHHGSLARSNEVEVEELLKKGEIVPRRHFVARARHRYGRRRPRHPGRVAEVGRRGLQRVGRAGHELGAVSRGASSRSTARTCSSRPSSSSG